MELMRRRRSGRVSPGREAEESRAPVEEGVLVADESEPEEGGPMGGGAGRDAHSADGRGGDPGGALRARPSSRTRGGVPQALRPGMDDEQVVAAEESSRSAFASRQRKTSKLSSMGSGRESSSKASPATEPSSTTRWRRARGGCEPFLV